MANGETGRNDAEVCFLLEGTYPYVAGGVSSWVHQIITGHPELTFDLYFVGARAGQLTEKRYALPANVRGLTETFCQDPRQEPVHDREALVRYAARVRRRERRRPAPSRVLRGLRSLHLERALTPSVLEDLASADLPLDELLHGRASFELATELSDALAPDAPFLELFWQLRSMHVPLVHLLSNLPRPAGRYHAVSTGYAGAVGAVASLTRGRPLILTEHGLYARERDLELTRAGWAMSATGTASGPAFRRIWSHFFHALANLAYLQSSRIVTLSDVNRRKEIQDGAPEDLITVVPNGVNLPQDAPRPEARSAGAPMRVGFVGRVVPIKDVITFVKACDLALRKVPLEVRIIGPDEEDPLYARRCKDLVATLGRQEQIRFVGPQPAAKLYRDLDVVVLTSFSEGQPLVILEGYAHGLPTITTDVGACRELVEGRGEEDRALGPGGIVTRVAAPVETAAALVLLASDAELRRTMGEAGRVRVSRYYQLADMLRAYGSLYREVSP